jgi:methionyl aminopeptidase
MSIKTIAEELAMERAGRATRAVLNVMKASVAPGISTAELDAIGLATMRSFGARSAPALVYGFPGANCISVNDQVVHGVPGPRRLQSGDLVKLDVTLEVDGYMADSCETVAVGSVSHERARLQSCAIAALSAGIAAVHPGARAFQVGRAIERVVQGSGFTVVRDLTGHGIGRTIHEAPTIPNHYDPRCNAVLTEGMVFTIEPIVSAGSARTITLRDGWTLRTRDRADSAHQEHTVVVTRDGARLLTA